MSEPEPSSNFTVLQPCTKDCSRGLYFGPKTIFILPLLLKMIFSPSHDMSFFRLPLWPFCLNSSLFCIILPFYFPFSQFSFPLLSFSFYFLFLFYFPPFSLCLFIFFPQMISANILPPPPGGGRYFPIYSRRGNIRARDIIRAANFRR